MAKKKAAKKTSVKKSTRKKAPAKKAATKKKAAATKKRSATKKAATKKTAAKKVTKKRTVSGSSATKSTSVKRTASKGKVKKSSASSQDDGETNGFRPAPTGPVKMTPFLKAQNQRLLDLRDSLVDAMAGVAQDNLRSNDGADASAFGMHQADAGSDAYDRDFALNLLSQEQDALYEIEEALGRIKLGTYGICEISGKKIMRERLEAIPFARFTVECQAQLERENGGRGFRRPVRHQLFDSESGVDSDED